VKTGKRPLINACKYVFHAVLQPCCVRAELPRYISRINIIWTSIRIMAKFEGKLGRFKESNCEVECFILSHGISEALD
jgi:hypothetical protein